MEVPPISKKLSSIPIAGIRSTSIQVSAINFFIRSMQPGSILVVYVYAFATAKTNRQEIDRYFDKIKKSRPLTLPSGQGIYFF
jgi:hypothetical protein